MIPLNWELARLERADAEPQVWMPAQVPGCVQFDYARAHDWPDLHWGENARAYVGLEDSHWLYRAMLRRPPAVGEREIWLVAKGIDYDFDIGLDGHVLHRQEGMFTPVELNLSEHLRDEAVHCLEVLIRPAPKRADAPAMDRKEADQSCKPAVSYGWDWHPYLPVLGIWDEIGLELRERERITACELFYELNETRDEAVVRFVCETTTDAGVVYELRDPDGVLVAGGSEPELRIASPRLWWCNGEGEPNLYTWCARIASRPDSAVWSGTVGFRTLRLVMNADLWTSVDGTRSWPPMTIELNGRRIFAKGTNWVNPELAPGDITRATYEPLVELARAAHMNLFRCWGGAIVNKDSFYDLCDQAGIMVWQEFPLACNNYNGGDTYLRVLEREARSIIRRLRGRACLALWCGGNELFNGWSQMTDQSLSLRLLNKVCYEEDPGRPFLPTSPVMGVSHGSYLFIYPNGMEVMAAIQARSNSAYTEFGQPSIAAADYLAGFIPSDELFPPRPGGTWEFHHAFNAWEGLDRWICLKTLEQYFGSAPDFETLVWQSQLLQSEGYKAVFEEARRQKPVCSMALNWCWNEPWKTAANNSLISWPARPKPAYEAVAQSLRPSLAALRIPRFSWRAGEELTVEPWFLHDAPADRPARSLRVSLTFADPTDQGASRSLLIGIWQAPAGPANENAAGAEMRFRLPEDAPAGIFHLSIRCEEDPALDSDYRLMLQQGAVIGA